MLVRIQRAALVVCLLIATPASAQFLTNGVIRGTDTPKRSVFLTFDDGPDEPGPDGLTQSEKVANFLNGPVSLRAGDGRPETAVLKSIRASFAMVTCHFVGSDKAAPNSAMCTGYGDVPESVANNVLLAGHDIFNHTVNHLPLTGIQDPTDVVYEVGHAQIEIDKLRGNSPRVFRAPGFAFDSAVATVLNADPSTGGIIGPIDADVGGGFQVNGSWIGGDWDCFALNLGVPFCGDLYVDAIQQAEHGVVVLLHVRNDTMTGRDGNPFPLDLTRYIVGHLGPEYEFLPLDAIPGVRGDLMTGAVTQVSSEFGASDGQGQVVAGALAGPWKPPGVCKARGATIACMTSDGKGGLSASSAWLTIGDPTWIQTYGSAFWLADINGTGYADLVFPASDKLWVALNNEQGGFYPPFEYFDGPIADPRSIRIGKVAGSSRDDLVMWPADAAAPALYTNDGLRFEAPPASAAVSTGPPDGTDVGTAQLIDIDGDGRDDLVLRGNSQVLCAHSTGTGFGPLQACSEVGGPFAQPVSWWNAAYPATFGVAHINGPVIVNGMPSGVIFAPFSNSSVTNRYRYLCNDCFTNASDVGWKPERRASQIVWGDFTQTGADSPLFVRADGLYLAVTQLPQ